MSPAVAVAGPVLVTLTSALATAVVVTELLSLAGLLSVVAVVTVTVLVKVVPLARPALTVTSTKTVWLPWAGSVAMVQLMVWPVPQAVAGVGEPKVRLLK